MLIILNIMGEALELPWKLEKKNRFKWKLHVELIDVAWSTNNAMNFKLACQQERSDESKQNILQYMYVVHRTSWLWLVQVKTT